MLAPCAVSLAGLSEGSVIKGLFTGMATIDLQYLVDAYPPQNRKVNARRFALAAGGPATNAAVAFAHLGGRSTLCAAVGDHPFATFMHQELTGLGVEVRDLAPASPILPPCSSILTTAADGQRTVIAYAASSNTAAEEAAADIIVADFDILLLDGFQLPVARRLAAQARAAGIPVVLDGGSWKPGLEALLEWVDIAICSADFRPPGDENDHSAQALFDYLYARGVHQAAITRGEKPILFYDTQQIGEISVPPVPVVDTLGAGDIFHGAFCYYYAARPNFTHALSQAAQVAATSCTSFGTRSWMDL